MSGSVTKDAKGAGAPAPFGRIVNVTKTFNTAGQPVPAVKDVSFQFRKGDLISLLGPCGCGKTTVLKMMGGLIPATSGLLELDGKAITAPFPGVGVVFQAPTLMPWRSVLGNVLFPMEVLGKNDATRESARTRNPQTGRPRRIRKCLSAAALGRNAAARCALPGDHPRALNSADGRAVRRAGRIDTAGDERPPARSPAGYRRNRPFRHAQYFRGDLPV